MQCSTGIRRNGVCIFQRKRYIIMSMPTARRTATGMCTATVKRMVEDGRDCSEVLVQLAAVRSALNNTAKIILKDHIEHCIAGAAADASELQELNDAIDKFI